MAWKLARTIAWTTTGQWVAVVALTGLMSLGCLEGAPSTTAVPDAGDAASTSSDGPATETAGCTSTLTYASFGMTFLDRYCGNCHGFTQATAQSAGASISAAAGTGTFMPPGTPSPTAQERAELVTWIACGAQ